MRSIKKFAGTLVLIMGASLSVNAQQFNKPEDAIKYRKSAFVVMNAQFDQLASMVKGNVPYDAKIASEGAAAVEELSKLPWAGFAEGTDKGETKARPEIWTETAKFKDAQAKLMMESGKLATAAKTGKLEDLKVAVSATGGACKNCHENFKSK